MADLPIIMVTAKDQSEDIVEALKLGANDYVTKPIDFPRSQCSYPNPIVVIQTISIKRRISRYRQS